MLSPKYHSYPRGTSRSLVSDDEYNEGQDTVSALPPNDVFVDRKSNHSDEEGFGNEEVFAMETEDKEEADCRDPIINRIDSLRETRMKVVRRKKPSTRRHMTPQHSLQPSPSFTLRMSDSEEELVTVKRGMLLKQVLMPYFEANSFNVLSFDFFLDGSKSALPLTAQSDFLAGHVIHAVRKDPNSIREPKERKKRGSSTGATLSNSNTNLAAPQRDKALPRQRRASFGFLFPPPSSAKSTELEQRESSFSTQRRTPVKISHAQSLQHLSIRDSDHSDMPGGTLPRIKGQPSPLQRFSRLLSPSKERLERLEETLQAFDTTGIPTRYSPTTNDRSFSVKSESLRMERTWEDIVSKSQDLSLQDKLQQSVIWELLCTEANYIRSLKAVIEVHLATLVHLQNSNEHILSEIDVKKMFSNFEQIYIANGTFWKRYFYKLLKTTRKTGKPLNVQYLHEGFINISKYFSPYISFCNDTNACRKYVQSKQESDLSFTKLLRWADQKISADCNKEGIKDQLSKPFQRLMRYKLLLVRIREETGDRTQRDMLDAMVNRVAAFVQDVDDRVDASQKFDILFELSQRMDYTIPPDSAGEEYSRFTDKFPVFNLLLPMPHNGNYRELLFEGSLKYRDNSTKWIDVNGYLFTDMFLVAKAKRGTNDRIKVLRPPIKLEKIFIEKYMESPLQYLFYVLDDFGYVRMIHAVTAHGPKKLNEWIDKIKDAKARLTSGAVGIDSSKLPPGALLERRSSVTLVVTPASPNVSASSARTVTSTGSTTAPGVGSSVSTTQTLAITDMRRRFRSSNSSDEGPGTRADELSPRVSPATSHLSLELEEATKEEELEGLADVEEDAESADNVFGESPGRQRTRFLRTASPVQRRHQQQHLRQLAAEAADAGDQAALDDNPCDMAGAAFRNRRGSRGDRRYRTADSVMPGANPGARSASIHKRLSLNYGGTGASGTCEASATSSLPPTSPTGVPGLPATSVESFQSSSGFSSSGSAQHLHSGSDYSEPGGIQDGISIVSEAMMAGCLSSGRALDVAGPQRDRGPTATSAKRMSAARHCMSLNDLSRLHLDTISDTNDNEEDSPEGNSSSTSVRSVLKQYVVVHSSDGEATDV